jgi:hypothetical protein
MSFEGVSGQLRANNHYPWPWVSFGHDKTVMLRQLTTAIKLVDFGYLVKESLSETKFGFHKER